MSLAGQIMSFIENNVLHEPMLVWNINTEIYYAQLRELHRTVTSCLYIFLKLFLDILGFENSSKETYFCKSTGDVTQASCRKKGTIYKVQLLMYSKHSNTYANWTNFRLQKYWRNFFFCNMYMDFFFIRRIILNI